MRFVLCGRAHAFILWVYRRSDAFAFGMELIDRELHKIPNEKVRTLAAQHISDISSSNRRDFRF